MFKRTLKTSLLCGTFIASTSASATPLIEIFPDQILLTHIQSLSLGNEVGGGGGKTQTSGDVVGGGGGQYATGPGNGGTGGGGFLYTNGGDLGGGGSTSSGPGTGGGGF